MQAFPSGCRFTGRNVGACLNGTCCTGRLLLWSVFQLAGLHIVAGAEVDSGSGARLLALVVHTQRPRVLVCGREGCGQSHLGPAILDALEGLPVHSIGLPSLLSDASARCVSRLPPSAWVMRPFRGRLCLQALCHCGLYMMSRKAFHQGASPFANGA